jgi:hypothetical protein
VITTENFLLGINIADKHRHSLLDLGTCSAFLYFAFASLLCLKLYLEGTGSVEKRKGLSMTQQWLSSLHAILFCFLTPPQRHAAQSNEQLIERLSEGEMLRK